MINHNYVIIDKRERNFHLTRLLILLYTFCMHVMYTFSQQTVSTARIEVADKPSIHTQRTHCPLCLLCMQIVYEKMCDSVKKKITLLYLKLEKRWWKRDA